MAFALRLLYLEERHYIHRLYSTKAKSGEIIPKTTSNMNFALLFESEAQAKHWREKKGIPGEFEVVFIPVAIQESPKSEKKKYYNVLKSGRSLEDSIPDFLKEG